MKTVIEMAGQAFETPGTEPAFCNGFWTVTQEELERFADLVRADERARMAEQPSQRKQLTDDFLRKLHHVDQFGLFCDYDEFEQIARAIEAKHNIKGDA